MNAKECIEGRRSIRKFKEEKGVPHEILESIIAEAAYAPSWKNTQITRYIAVESKEIRDRIAMECTTGFNAATIHSAPVLMVITVIKKRSGFERDGSYTTVKGDTWQMFDAGVACQTFCLAAYEHGIGSVIQGIFDYGKVAEILNVSDDREVIALIPIGYPDEAPEAPKRKTTEDLLSYL